MWHLVGEVCIVPAPIWAILIVTDSGQTSYLSWAKRNCTDRGKYKTMTKIATPKCFHFILFISPQQDFFLCSHLKCDSLIGPYSSCLVADNKVNNNLSAYCHFFDNLNKFCKFGFSVSIPTFSLHVYQIPIHYSSYWFLKFAQNSHKCFKTILCIFFDKN